MRDPRFGISWYPSHPNRFLAGTTSLVQRRVFSVQKYGTLEQAWLAAYHFVRSEVKRLELDKRCMFGSLAENIYLQAIATATGTGTHVLSLIVKTKDKEHVQSYSIGRRSLKEALHLALSVREQVVGIAYPGEAETQGLYTEVVSRYKEFVKQGKRFSAVVRYKPFEDI